MRGTFVEKRNPILLVAYAFKVSVGQIKNNSAQGHIRQGSESMKIIINMGFQNRSVIYYVLFSSLP